MIVTVLDGFLGKAEQNASPQNEEKLSLTDNRDDNNNGTETMRHFYHLPSVTSQLL